jgi:signal transduction histidine kinase
MIATQVGGYFHVLDDYRLAKARWGWPAFGLLYALLFGLGHLRGWPAELLALLTQLWLGWCAAWMFLASARRLWQRAGWALPAPVLIGLLMLAVGVAAGAAAAAGYALLPWIGRGLPSAWAAAGPWSAVVLAPVAATAAAMTAVLLVMQASVELRLARQAAQAAERERLVTLERELLGSQLKVLQAQIEPHFLYNSLANVQHLLKQDRDGADRMLGHLIDYLRAAVPSMRERSATLASEAALARSYLALMAFRMGERLQWSVDVPEALSATPLPPTVLGTLIENAIKHGLEPSAAGGRIDIRARRDEAPDGAMLVVEVADTGLGIDVSGTRSVRSGSGVGLANARERLVLLHGPRTELDLMPNEPRGVIARMRIPLD